MGSNKPTFCPIPWVYANFTTKGNYLFCDMSMSTEDQGLAYGPDGMPLRPDTVPLKDFRQIELWKNVRRRMLAGEESPETCARCIENEGFGLISRRILEREKGYITLAEARSKTAPDGSLSPDAAPIASLNVRLGNHCNLACKSCGPAQSSGWYKEWFRTRHKGFQDGKDRHLLSETQEGRVFLPASPYLWFHDETFWDEIMAGANGLREIHFTGGEPFLSTSHIRLLERLAEQGWSKQIKLEYATNLTVLPERLTRAWEKFDQVNISVSMDGPPAMNEYIRHPSRHSVLMRNLEKLDALPENIIFWVTCTISIFNVGQFPEFVRWIFRSGFSRLNRRHPGSERFLSYHMLRKPEAHSAKALPSDAKTIIRKRYEDFLHGLPSQTDITSGEQNYIHQNLLSILAFVDAEDKSKLLGKLVAELNISDEFRGKHFSDVDQEVWQLLNDNK